MKKILLFGFTSAVLMASFASLSNATLVARWDLDESSGSTAVDSVGGVNGTLVGGATFNATGGISGGAVEITDGYITMGNNFPPSATFSLQAWVKTNPGDTNGMFAVSKHHATLTHGYVLGLNNYGDGFSAVNTASFYSANGAYTTAVGNVPVNDGNWHQLVGVYDNGVTRIYIDGALAGTGSAGFSDASADFMIGGLFDAGGTPVNYFQGSVDEVRVYDNALSPTEVNNLYTGVPEPTSAFLLGLGGLGLAAVRRKRTNVGL